MIYSRIDAVLYLDKYLIMSILNYILLVNLICLIAVLADLPTFKHEPDRPYKCHTHSAAIAQGG